MLKQIPSILPPVLLKVLCEMGHSDRILLADANFPAENIGRNCVVIRCDGHGIPVLLDAILQLMPLDSYVPYPVRLMQVAEGDTVQTPVWDEYVEILRRHEPGSETRIKPIERFDFYEQAKTAYAVIATGETALYANIMLQKGVL